MKKLPILITGILAMTGAVFAADANKPNIVFLLADDLGGGDLHCYGHPYSRTPNLDRLAADGTRFMQFNSTGATCCPARTGLMTSKFPATYATYPAGGGFGNRISVTELLKKQGYATGHFGKWHIGPDQTPGTYGIDSIGSEEEESVNKRVDERGRDAHIYDQAIRFIEDNKDHPFYVNVWGHVSHATVNPPQILVDKWSSLKVNEEDFPEPMRQKFEAVRKAGGDVDDAMRRYLADVESLDDAAGRLLNRLDELGLRDNTIVVFSSDQGCDMRAKFDEKPEKAERAKASESARTNLRFNLMGFNNYHRGGKHTFLNGGAEVAFIVRWPGHVPASRVDENSVLSGVDWLPTLCAITGIEINTADFDGEDVSAAWLGGEHVRTKPLLWKTSAPNSDAAIRVGPWKLFSPTTKRGQAELYNVLDDPFEANNVARNIRRSRERFRPKWTTGGRRCRRNI